MEIELEDFDVPVGNFGLVNYFVNLLVEDIT